jgi:hypothetical protein
LKVLESKFWFKILIDDSIYIVDTIEPDCSIDCAHDMGVLSAEFCNVIHNDPVSSSFPIIIIFIFEDIQKIMKIEN